MDSYEVFNFSPITCMQLVGERERMIARQANLLCPIARFFDRFNPRPVLCNVAITEERVSAQTLSFPGCDGILMMIPFIDFIPLFVNVFAHEYCHRTIDHKHRGGCHFIEEIICTVASWVSITNEIQSAIQQHRAEEGGLLATLLQQTLLSHKEAFRSIREEGIRNISNASRTAKDYVMYEAAALMLLPIFLDNPDLWGILRHIGDIDPSLSSEEFLAHLRQSADPAYLPGIDEMIALLLP